jgi:hypothetical protein
MIDEMQFYRFNALKRVQMYKMIECYLLELS